MAEPKPSQAKITIAYKDISTNIVHIDDAKPKSISYNCLGCNEFLIVCNQGLKRNHYFRHEKNSNCDGISKEEKRKKKEEEEQKKEEEEERLLDEERVAFECKKKEEEERRKSEEEARIRQEKYEKEQKEMEEKRIKIQKEMQAKREAKRREEIKIKKINDKKKREKIKEIEKAKDIDKGTIYKYLENETWFINHPIEEFNQSFKSIKLLYNFVVKNDLMNTLDKDARIHLKNK
tara:strand:+ start:16 stop:717 length:702 start_codon:yes stop_codon:yes gene_type:complete